MAYATWSMSVGAAPRPAAACRASAVIAAGAVDDRGDGGVVEVCGGAAGQVGGRGPVQRRHVEPGGRGVAQRRLGVRGEPVRGAQRDQHTAMRGQVRQRGQGGRVGVLDVVEDQQGAAQARAYGLREQVNVVDRQPGPHGPGQSERGYGGQHRQPAAGVDRTGHEGGGPAQDGAAAGAGRSGDHDQTRPAQPGGGGHGHVLRVRHRVTPSPSVPCLVPAWHEHGILYASPVRSLWCGRRPHPAEVPAKG
jgi:hypothetical protein